MLFRAALLTGAIGFGGVGASAETAGRDIPLKAGAYLLDASRTRIGFSLMRLGFAYYSGTFSDASGSLRIDPAKPTETTLQVTMPVASLATGNGAVDADLKGPNWFDAARYPTATFISTIVTSTGPDTADITGTLTLHGATQAEILQVHYLDAAADPIAKPGEAGFEAATTIKRSDFGLSAFFPVIGDDVRLTISGVFVARH
jgi:polyisoprenoid-binding protein YceI